MVEEYGLIGRGISHSFSANFFNKKFAEEEIDASYHLFDLKNIEELPSLIASRPALRGLNITSPYKKTVIKHLDSIHENAAEIGAVNTVLVKNSSEGRIKLEGYNTDVEGFRKTIKNILPKDSKALILGTGGASDAVAQALKLENIPYLKVSRKPEMNEIGYEEMNNLISSYNLIINATPLGMFPRIQESPDIDYDKITSDHICYDLIYNPKETQFLLKCRNKGAVTINGLCMLINQARLSWEIWQEDNES